jgi:hypothetical protein
MLAAAKYIGAGLACSGLIGAGIRIGTTILGSLILITARYPHLLEIKFSITYLTTMKLIIVMVLIGIHLYLIFIEYLYNKDNKFSNNNNNNNNIIQYKAAGILGTNLSRNLKGIGKTLVGGATLYQGYSQITKDMQINSENFKELEQMRTEIKDAQLLLYQAKEDGQIKTTSLAANHLRMNEYLNQLETITSQKKGVLEELTCYHNSLGHKKPDQLFVEMLLTNLNYLAKEEENQLKQLNEANQIINKELGLTEYSSQPEQSLQKENENSIDTNKIEIDNDIKTKFIGSDLLDMYNNLNALGKIAVGLLFLNSAILSALVSIVFIFYGDFLISHFNLETKYPKLTNLIQLRRQFQQYYLITSILIILSSILIEFIFCISILTL